jgi:hypothetical protein
MSNLIYNTKHAYVHLKMAENHLKCIEDSLDKYANNKFRDLQNANKKMFKKLELELEKRGELEEIEDMIIKFHEHLDEI